MLNSAKEAKRAKAQELLNLPQSERKGLEGAVLRQEARLALTDGSASAASSAQSSALSTLPQKGAQDNSIRAMLPSKASLICKPKWHPPWKLYRVIAGHTGWVRSVAVEPNNEWFATGGADRMCKVRN